MIHILPFRILPFRPLIHISEHFLLMIIMSNMYKSCIQVKNSDSELRVASEFNGYIQL